MNELTIFENKEFGSVRTIVEGEKVLFCAKDVAKILGYSNLADAVGKHCKHVMKRDTPTQGGMQKLNFIYEGDVYRLIARSKLPEAQRFEAWVVDDVLPSIRKHGLYAMDELLNNPDVMIEALTALKAEREARKRLETENAVQAQQIAEMQPKATYYDIVLACSDLVPISVIAKDYGWTAQHMNEQLKTMGIQYKIGGVWLLKRGFAERGYTGTRTSVYEDDRGMNHSKVHTYWTQKGRLFIYETLKQADILPLIERVA